MTKPTPPAETTVSPELVRALLQEQIPELADQPLTPVANGFDNEIFRLGDDHAIRLPRRSAAAPLVENEQRWLPLLAPLLPIAVPVPVHCGRPAMGYPWPWSVVPWFDGVPLAHSPALDQDRLIADLSGTLNALHREADREAPANHYRGVPLAERDALTRGYIDAVDGIDGDEARRVWEESLAVAEWDATPIWLHGDLHPLNLLVRGGRITAVIDWGDLTSGDPATDLAVAWMLLDGEGRLAFRAASRIDDGAVDDDTWARARGWALSIALAMVAHSADDPTLRRIGIATLRQVLHDRLP